MQYNRIILFKTTNYKQNKTNYTHFRNMGINTHTKFGQLTYFCIKVNLGIFTFYRKN